MEGVFREGFSRRLRDGTLRQKETTVGGVAGPFCVVVAVAVTVALAVACCLLLFFFCFATSRRDTTPAGRGSGKITLLRVAPRVNVQITLSVRILYVTSFCSLTLHNLRFALPAWFFVSDNIETTYKHKNSTRGGGVGHRTRNRERPRGAPSRQGAPLPSVRNPGTYIEQQGAEPPQPLPIARTQQAKPFCFVARRPMHEGSVVCIECPTTAGMSPQIG